MLGWGESQRGTACVVSIETTQRCPRYRIGWHAAAIRSPSGGGIGCVVPPLSIKNQKALQIMYCEGGGAARLALV